MTACAAGPPPPTPGASSSTTSASSAPTSSSGTPGPGTTGAPSAERALTLAFAGDIHFERQLQPRLEDSAQEWAERLPELARADLAMANLETAVTTRGAPEAKRFTFRTSPAALRVLHDAGLDVLSMANNHAADYGSDGLSDTLAAIDASRVPVAGIGRNEAAAFAPVTKEVRGVRVAVLASSQVDEETARHFAAGPDSPGIAVNLDPERLRAATRAAVASHDLVVVYLHWGTEGSTCPSEGQRRTAQQLQEDGADIIVGTHAHRPQGSGWLGRAFVGYGLGNFVWYNTSRDSRSSGVLTVSVDPARAKARRAGTDASASPVTNFSWTPKLISTGGIPRTPEGASKSRLDGLAEAAQVCSGLRS